MELQGDFRKIKPPSFDGEREEDAEEWLLNMIKYFKVYDYESNMKAHLDIYQFRGKSTLWLEEVKSVQLLE